MILDDRSQTGLSLHGWRECRSIPPRSGFPIAAQGHINDSWIERLDVRITKAEAREGSGSKVLDDDVGIAAEPCDDLARFRIVQIDTEISLSGILLHVIEPHSIDIGKPDSAEIAGRRLNLCDVGAEIA